jgi:acetyltransferase-like isoleucine patch superfamily enzyme
MIDTYGRGCLLHDTLRTYGRNRIGRQTMILENVILGYPTSDVLLSIMSRRTRNEDLDYEGVKIGHHCIIRSEAVIYRDVVIGDYVRTGHKVLIREHCRIGSHVLVGTNVVIDNDTTIGSRVSIQSTVYIPTGTVIEDRVFIGPNAVFLNDRFPIRGKVTLSAPTIKRGATIGGNATILPGVTVGEGAMVAAGAIVTKDVPAWHLAIGAPARCKPLPKSLRKINRIV